MNHLRLLADMVTNITQFDIRLKTRRREYVEARYIYYKIAKDTYHYSLSRIGEEVNRDHATVMHGLRNVEGWLSSDKMFKEKYERVVKYFNEKIESGHMTTEIADDIIADNAILKSENEMLSDKVSSLSLQLKLIERQAENYELFHNVLERMKQQVPVSKISIFEEKLNRFMNGLQL